MDTLTRVKQIMQEEHMDTNSEVFVVDMAIMYARAQRDYITEQLEALKNK